MISYTPFYEYLKCKQVSEYHLMKNHGISSNILHRMKKGEHITTKTLDALCRALACGVGDILVYQEEDIHKNPPEAPGDFSIE